MRNLFLSACLLFSFYGGLAAAPASEASNSQQDPEQSRRPADQGKLAPTSGPQADRGEQVFTANCGRCHTPPGGISQRVTGTVVMHMRVRARLSREDEQALLRFLAP